MTSPSSTCQTDSPTTSTSDWIWEIECAYEGPVHEYPYDWVFGGSNESDPRSDPRWRPTTYEYYNSRIEIIHVTQTPLCDDEAIDHFTWVASLGPGFDPVNISARRPDGIIEMLKVRYDKGTDTAHDL